MERRISQFRYKKIMALLRGNTRRPPMLLKQAARILQITASAAYKICQRCGKDRRKKQRTHSPDRRDSENALKTPTENI